MVGQSNRELLTKARDFLAEHHWTQGEYARDEDDAKVSIYDEHAVSFCVVGALYRAVPRDHVQGDMYALYALLLDADAEKLDEDDVTWKNDLDLKSKSEALAWFDEAIKRAEVHEAK